MSEDAKQLEQTPADRSSEAMKILEEELAKKRQACQNEIVAVMEKYQMQFDVVTTIRSNGQINHQIEIVPRPAGQGTGQHQPQE